ncbi:MAG: hypothetical protein IJZ80_07790 [Clostridia bacterium]|nr:hypothetical protein [Clostridia bacterium]
MVQGKVLFDRFEFPVIRGLDYLMDEENPSTDYLFINEPRERFSMYFERGQKPFEVMENGATDKEYCLFQMRRPNRTIHFYCPERLPDRESVMWYFYVEIFDGNGRSHVLPGQMRVVLADGCLRMSGGKEKFIEILENVQLAEAGITA